MLFDPASPPLREDAAEVNEDAEVIDLADVKLLNTAFEEERLRCCCRLELSECSVF